MGNANGGLNMEQVDNAMAAGLGVELATAVVDALQSLPVTEGMTESSKNENIVAGLTEVFDNAQQKFPGWNLGGSDRKSLAAGVAHLVSKAQSAITETPMKDEDTDELKKTDTDESELESNPVTEN